MFSPERNFTDWKLMGFADAPAYLFESIESTHKLMKDKARAGEIAPGTLFVADSQSNGIIPLPPRTMAQHIVSYY